MEHLIELRSRLIKALIAFGVMFAFCFFFAKEIYNILVWPFVWVAGAENSKFIYTALLEYFITQLKLAMFGAAFLSFPVVAGADLHVRRARPLQATSATPSCRIWSRRRSSSRSARRWSISWCMPMLVRFSLGMQQTGGGEAARSRCCRRSANICR